MPGQKYLKLAKQSLDLVEDGYMVTNVGVGTGHRGRFLNGSFIYGGSLINGRKSNGVSLGVIIPKTNHITLKIDLDHRPKGKSS